MKRYLMTIFTGILLILSSNSYAKEDCEECHKKITVSVSHETVSCVKCHEPEGDHYALAADFKNNAKGCLSCHEEYEGMLKSPMHTRNKEKRYVKDIFEQYDPEFFGKNCEGCHVRSCMDCHAESNTPHKITKPGTRICLDCHNDYYIGADYTGLGIREDHERYQRGIKAAGKYHQKMLPDVHYEKGMDCGKCHSMKSLAIGRPSSKVCKDCHSTDKGVIEHSIDAHLQKMACSTCHAAWAPVEYGTFWMKFEEDARKDYFKWLKSPSEDYRKSSYKRFNRRPHIGVNKDGRYAPIRPMFINIFSLIRNKKALFENKVLSYDYRVFAPHTIRRETRLCPTCHEKKEAFLIYDNESRIFMPEKDGMPFKSFKNGKNANVFDGRAVTPYEYRDIHDLYTDNKTLQLKKWNNLLKVF